MPKPFLNKLIVHGAIGFFCVLFGCIYGLTKKQKIIFRSTDQKEYHFTFDKNIRLLSGHYYRLYFRNVANLSGEEKVTPDLLAYEELSL